MSVELRIQISTKTLNIAAIALDMGFPEFKSDRPQRIYVEITANHPLARQILDWFEVLNQSPSVEPIIWWQCQTALKEIFDNIVEHAHAGLSLDTPIAIEAIRSPDVIEIRLWDCGSSIDLKKKLETMPDLIENHSDRGRGLHLVNRIAHQWSYTRTIDERNCFFMAIKTQRVPEALKLLEY